MTCNHTQMPQQSLIFGYYGWKNTGDDAMLYAILKQLYTLYPRKRIAVLSRVPVKIPEETADLVKFVRLAPHVIFREFLNSSDLIIGGGTHIEDYGTKKIRPLKNIFRILVLAVLAKLLRKEIYFVGVGIGPVSTIWERLLLRIIVQLTNFISVRDTMSYEILETLGVGAKTRLAFDTSALLEPLSTDDTAFARESNNDKILGLSISPVFKIYYCDRKKDLLLAQEIAKVLNKCMEEDPQVTVYLFVFKGQSKDDDVALTKLLQGQLNLLERVKLVPYEPDPIKRLYQVSQCYYFVGMRFHSSLFAYLSGVPMLMIDYHPKCRALANDIGLPEIAIVTPSEILNDQFSSYLKHLRENPNNFRATLPIEIAKKRAQCGIDIFGEDRFRTSL